ncbi:MAG: anti-sigma factor [Geminicoccaceae bacterium]|nr:anti-sigma factor [Geminicoccaceae bacterium]
MNGGRDDAGDDLAPDELRAAEYALGTLRGAGRARFEADLAKYPDLQALVAAWEDRFVTLNELTPPEPPRPEVWRRIEREVGLDQKAGMKVRHRALPAPPAVWRRWWESLAFWRGLAGLAAAVAVIAIGMNLLQPRFNPEQMATELVAALQSQEGSGVSFVAFYDTQSGAVRLLGLSGQQVADKDYELWYIRGDEPAVSMGVIPVDERTEIPLDQAAREKIADGTILAVTLEQKGGSPTGVAQGPIVALGKATPI